MPRIIFLISLFASVCAWGQDAPAPVPPVAAPVEIPDDGVRVAVLGYHDFAEKKPATQMRIQPSKFRKQMETIRQLGIKVISMEDFSAWKKTGKEIPKKSIVLTFDDGWKPVYTDVFPILKEFGYPFTIYLYKDYVDGGGRALTTPMIKEMMTHGATIGSHSVSHPYPVVVKSFRKKGENAYDAYLRKELGESKRFLESKFSCNVTTYAYPGGYYTEEMLKLGEEFGYDHMFTVIPGKVKRSSPDKTLPRYIILGNHDSIFEMATSFREDQVAIKPGEIGAPTVAQTTPYPVTPEAGTIIHTRLPIISADLSKVENLNPASLTMKVSGFGEVPATYSAETKTISWQVNRRLRQPSYQVAIHWKDNAGKAPENPLHWSFHLDRESTYLPDAE